jgi:hypothetical protein
VLALAIVLTLVPPVPGAIARGFEYAGDPFARGHHRGVDLAASPGALVRAACGGRVTFAGRAGANGRAVTVRCGPWSVTHLPLRVLAVHAGELVAPGATLGTAATSSGHEGLHLGVRRTSNPRGYVDPAPLLRIPPRQAPPAAPRTTTRRPDPPPPHPEPLPSGPAPATAGAASTARAPSTAPPLSVARAASTAAAHAGSSPLAPWPAWAGLALLLAGAAGAGAARRSRTRRASPARAGAAAVR